MNTKGIIGASYRIIETGLIFKVKSIKSYSAEEITKKYENILSVKPGYLAAISFRGTLIPNITLEDGVVRLVEIEVDGAILKTPKIMSEVLRIKNHVDHYSLKKVS